MSVPGAVMMSLPILSHVPSRGYNVTSCLVPCSFLGGGGGGGGLPLGEYGNPSGGKTPVKTLPSHNFAGGR